MKTTKLVIGILSMVVFPFVVFQSFMVGLGNISAGNGEVGGTGGAILSFLMLSGGIVSVATRSGKGKGGTIACIILYGLASLLGFYSAGIFIDLNIWAGWCLICAVIHLVSLFTKPKE